MSFRLSEDAKVTAAFKRGGKPVKTVRTAFLFDGKRSLVLKANKPFASGRYSARLTAVDREANVSKPVKITFSVPG